MGTCRVEVSGETRLAQESAAEVCSLVRERLVDAASDPVLDGPRQILPGHHQRVSLDDLGN